MSTTTARGADRIETRCPSCGTLLAVVEGCVYGEPMTIVDRAAAPCSACEEVTR